MIKMLDKIAIMFVLAWALTFPIIDHHGETTISAVHVFGHEYQEHVTYN